MDSGLYAACAGLVARTQALDTIAANVANSSSNGYRGQQDVFGTVLASAHNHRLSSMNQVTNSYGVLSGTHLDQTQGSMTRTGNDLDVAIQGPAYFKVQTSKGAVYTRNGAFQVSSSGALTTATGDAVLGEDGPVSVAKGKLTISGDGTLSVDGALAGKLKLVNFSSATELTSRGTGYYTAPASAEQQATDASVAQGALEGSNVSPVDGMVQLISAQRSAESMRHVLSMIDSEMDKTAAQDLPRVS
jgi:flagellar basal-body rod protein FlgF